MGYTIGNLDVSVHSIEELTGFNLLSVDKIYQHTSKDHTMQLFIQHINDGSQIFQLNALKQFIHTLASEMI